MKQQTEKILTMSDTVNVGKNKKVLVSDLVPVKGEIFKLIKKGLQFDDEVLKEAHIIKTIRDVTVKSVIVPHSREKKTYEKESQSLKNILKSINTLETYEGEEIVDEAPAENILSDEED